MPPKAPPKVAPGKKEPPKKKPKKSQLLQMAMDQATDDAHKLYKQHDVSRVSAESKDKLQRDHLQLDFTIEAERIAKERVIFGEVKKSLIEAEKLVYKEHEKHMQWKHVPDASRLPDVQRESDINTFLSVWKDYEAEQDTYHPETVVIAAKNATIPPPMPGAVNQTHSMLFIRGEQGIAVAKRRGMIDDELSRCLAAYQLAEVIENERDKVASLRLQEKMNFHDGNLRKVYEQVMRSLDFMTINTLLYYDAIIDDPEGETLMKLKPEINPVIKFGLWVKVKEITRSFTSLVFPYVEIRFDPKSNAQPKLPKALGLIKENVAVRVVQLSFDPYSGYGLKGKRYYALSCTVKVDLLTFQDRPKDCGEYLIRGETTSSHTLHYEEYPPKISETREDPGFRISFDVPSTLVIRQPTLLIGKWTPSLGEWEPCSHTIFGATFGGTARVDANPRRATFVTGELAHFAVLQEKVFDALFERWSFRPLTYDRLLFTLEGRRRNDPSDREFRILVEDAFCKLLAPDDEELEELRENWLEPTTLFRRLSQAGFNFILDDDDAKYMDGVLPKSEALEMKAYADMAQFCQYYSICSSKHNKLGEDADMALFRVSKQARGIEEEIDIYDIREDDTEEYHSIRYRRDNCVLAKFTEEEEKPDLNIKDECETHYNLYTLFLTLAPEEELRQQMDQTNFLLRRCVYQLLRLVRPLSWG